MIIIGRWWSRKGRGTEKKKAGGQAVGVPSLIIIMPLSS